MLSRLWQPNETLRHRRRGGWRQQAAESQCAPERSWTISRLTGNQLLLWADGLVSASRLQQPMCDAEAGNLDHCMVRKLSRIGTGNHAHEGLMQLLKSNTSIVTDISAIPGAVDGGGSHILRPSTIIRNYAKHYPDEFKERFGADLPMLKSFWTQFTQRFDITEHSLLRSLSPTELQYMIPLTMHEDAGL